MYEILFGTRVRCAVTVVAAVALLSVLPLTGPVVWWMVSTAVAIVWWIIGTLVWMLWHLLLLVLSSVITSLMGLVVIVGVAYWVYRRYIVSRAAA